MADKAVIVKTKKDMGSKLIKCGCYDVPPRSIPDPPFPAQPAGFKTGVQVPGVHDSPAAHYQEARYKNGLRVHNWSSSKQAFRCTICGSEKSA